MDCMLIRDGVVNRDLSTRYDGCVQEWFYMLKGDMTLKVYDAAHIMITQLSAVASDEMQARSVR